MGFSDGREEARCRDADPVPWAAAMSHPYGSKSAVENEADGPASCPSEKAEHWPRHWPRVRQVDGKLRAGDLSKRVLNKRPEVEPGLIS